ncbi:cGMP-dependent protein kinase 1 [Zeugodacus cucurbitae]|uniref:cGMP-dependent protein kinase 1 n=1 Tax=Zeugodacus cucurbitae TaxID=28588 RepID=UPI0023D9204B|nr:cGMP-dependent protein kinase 1 [Zeugodacus cucurbitae]XP_054083049.1 cGMP-dependent protein kinase 1 [Zeugodacus cucurbitae]XP_054083050.1 cGMP-dependent protein kinase 1 [Zeugodacus cucurbitae]
MACFPRKLRIFNRTTASFTPAEDENKDTMLNNTANPVQIGRYIRREETALFTPKSSEQQQTGKSPEQIIDNRNNRTSNNNNVNNVNKSNSNNNNTISGNNVNGSLINNGSGSNSSNVNSVPPKKFISNKVHNLSRNNSANKSNNNNNKSIVSNSLLKSVKERRPTALPSDAPNLGEEEEEQYDDDEEERETGELHKIVEVQQAGKLQALHVNIKQANGYKSNSSDLDTPTTPNSSTLAVRFFIGQHAHDEDTASAQSLDAGSYRSIKEVTAHGISSAQQTQQDQQHHQHHQQHKQLKKLQLQTGDVTDSGNNIVAITSTSLLQLPTPELTAQRNSERIASACSSPTLYGPQAKRNSKSKSWRKARGGASVSETPAHEVHIPPPPPLPPQPLTTASSSASLLSLRSNKIKRSSAVATSTTATPQIEEGGISANAEFATPPGYDVRYDGTTMVTATATAIAVPTTTTTANDATNDKEQTPTPKESDNSDTPQAHRVEGGLIFTRPNLPAKKDVHIEFIEKDNETRNLIRKAIERNDFLNNYMDKERKEMVIDAMAPTFYKKDSFIIHENDEGSEIYVSETGYFDVIKGGKVVGSFGPTTVFGELAILYNANRLASIRATANARVWKITRETFRQIMVLSESKERDENLTFLRAAPFLNDLSDAVLNKVVDLLQRKYYEPNACIVREGEVGNEFFIIRGGTVTIKKKNEQNVERVVDRRKRGDYFGEQALLNADRRQASVYADAPGTEVLKLDREAFISYLGTIPQLREKPEERRSAERKHSTRQSEFDNEYAQVQLTDLKKVATLGAGAFGCVDLVSYNDKTFALKIIKKIDVIKQDQVEHVYSEKHVMMKCRSSPFIIELYKTFRNEKFVYFLMEACMGGDVWTVMSQRRFFDERTAKFIAGCVVEAFDFLHSHNIIYRDLKPENLMLTTDGYCKLVDFGFAKHIPPNQKTNTFAGTPEYVAPEIILDRGHDRAVDYWALGILIFELLVGKTPFRGQNQIKIYQQILGGIDVIQMPSKIPRSAQGLIKHLCKQLPAERLGYQRRGILDIKRHSWFDNLDWNKLKYKQLPSPIKRPITCNTDLQYFGPAGVENDYDPPDETSGWDIDF